VKNSPERKRLHSRFPLDKSAKLNATPFLMENCAWLGAQASAAAPIAESFANRLKAGTPYENARKCKEFRL